MENQKNKLKGKIKNPKRVEELLSSGDWQIDDRQDLNVGQINFLGDETSYYDAETDEFCEA
jgi:hypothetical protein